MCSISLYGLYKIGDEVGTALIGRLYFGHSRSGFLFYTHHAVVGTDCPGCNSHDGNNNSD